MRLSPKERQYLIERIAQAHVFSRAQAYERDDARRVARTCIEAIEGAATEASTVKRAVTNIVTKMERTA